MIEQFKACLKDETGQGMTEYVLIITLVALAAIASFIVFRQALRDKVNWAATSLSNS
jgi:Flp pilus assembly pilin Flp